MPAFPVGEPETGSFPLRAVSERLSPWILGLASAAPTSAHRPVTLSLADCSGVLWVTAGKQSQICRSLGILFCQNLWKKRWNVVLGQQSQVAVCPDRLCPHQADRYDTDVGRKSHLCHDFHPLLIPPVTFFFFKSLWSVVSWPGGLHLAVFSISRVHPPGYLMLLLVLWGEDSHLLDFSCLGSNELFCPFTCQFVQKAKGRHV